MNSVFHKTDSGILIPDRAVGDERAVANMLRDHDRDLRLVPQWNQGGRIGYAVYRYMGSDRPSEFLLYWGDQSGPFPLSSALVDEVRKLDKNTVAHQGYKSAEQLNAEQKESQKKRFESDMEALTSDLKSMDGRSVTTPAKTWNQKRWREEARRRGWIK